MGDTEQDVEQQDETEGGTVPVAEKDQRKVFNPRTDIAALGHIVPKEWVTVPEFGNAAICVWGTTMADTITIASDAAHPDAKTDAEQSRRRVTSTILCTCHQGEEPDSPLTFNHLVDWAFVFGLPTSVVDRLHSTSRELDMYIGVRASQILDFFRIVGSLRACLTHIASRCGACTDCPRNSQENCPLQLLLPLSSLIG